MPAKYPVLTPEQVIKVLISFGFRKVAQKGSHVKFKKEGSPSRTVIVPMHVELAHGTLKSILEQAAIPLDDFMQRL